MSDLSDRLQKLLTAEPDAGLDYFAITILPSEVKRIRYSCFSGWVGYTEDVPRREVREASIVHADRMVKNWRLMGQTSLVIDRLEDMSLFFVFGGNAVVEEKVAREVVPNWLKPAVAANVGEFGFTHLETLPLGSLCRAPTPKHRMRILQRDGYRCRVCGRNPRDHVDLELHVHHIRPWAMGGVTEDSNLITLCHTCHNSPDPHFQFSLFDLIGNKGGSSDHQEYWAELLLYQKQVMQRARDAEG